MVARGAAASVMLQDGSVLVSGGYGDSRLQSSEVLTASALSWSAAIELPSVRSAHCMLQLTTGQLFLHGGSTGSGSVGDTYISTDMRTWERRRSSKKTRQYHACVEHDGYIWLADGTTEKYDLKTNSWTYGSDLPNYSYFPGVLMSNYGLMTYTGGPGNKNIYQLNAKQDGWIKVHTSLYIYEIIQAPSDWRDGPE